MKWEIKAQAEQGEADIYINDFIGDWIDDYWGFGVTSNAFIKELQTLPESVKTVRLHINSPGGDVVAANHIANTIRDQQARKNRVFVGLVEGAAWSAATIITSACEPTRIADNGIFMIHDPWTICLGNSRELRKQADVTDKFRDSIVAAYRWKSQLSEEELMDLMAAETWMDADEAVKNGFADEKIESVPIAALFDLKMVNRTSLQKIADNLFKVPEKFRDRIQAMFSAEPAKPVPEVVPAAPAPAAPTVDAGAIRAEAETRAREILAACTKAGVPEAASDFLDKGLTADEVKAKLSDADKIRARCAAAKLPERANKYIAAGMSVKEVADELIDVLIARQGPEINGHLGPESERQTTTKPKVASSAEIYELRKKKK